MIAGAAAVNLGNPLPTVILIAPTQWLEADIVPHHERTQTVGDSALPCVIPWGCLRVERVMGIERRFGGAILLIINA